MPDDEGAKAGKHVKSESTSKEGLFLGVLGAMLTIAFAIIRPALPLEADTPIGLGLVIITCLLLTWAIIRSKSRQSRRSAIVVVSWIVAVCVTGFTFFALQPQPTFYGRGQCIFGIDGYLWTRVWVKVTNDDQPSTHVYTVGFLWGAYEATVTEMITDDFYFTMSQQSFHSPPEDVTVTPAASITCGNGMPPSDALSRAVVGTDWHRDSLERGLQTHSAAMRRLRSGR